MRCIFMNYDFLLVGVICDLFIFYGEMVINTSYNVYNICILLYFNLIVSMLLTCVYIEGTIMFNLKRVPILQNVINLF